jgi:ABC-type phosphate transport system substrate-binding protein
MTAMKNAWMLAAAISGLAGCGKKEPDATPMAANSGIVVYGRENSSGTYMYFKEHVLNEADFAASTQALQGTAAVINAVSKDKRSIGYGGIGYLKGVRALKVKKDAGSPAIEPSLKNVVDGSYPISRYLYMYTIGEPEGAVKAFIDWARGKEGQKVCADVGYYPLPEDKQFKAAGTAPPKATITVKGSDTMVILGGKWAERFMAIHPEVVVQITGGGSGTGIKALIDGETHICQASRPMKPKEREAVKAKHGKEPVEFSVAMDGLAVFVHESNPIQEISLEQLKLIYTGKAKTWDALGGK